jgi:predicted ester cyclase
MAPDDARRSLVATTLEEVWNRKKWEATRGVYAEDVILHTPASPEPLHGREHGLRWFFDTLTTAHPDFRLDPQRIVVEGDTAAVRFVATGSSTGPLLGTRPTGRSFRITEAVFLEFGSHGLVREMWFHMNILDLMQQIGVMPVGPPPRAMVAMLRLANRLRGK